LFSAVMDDLIRLAPCPTVIVQSGGERPWPPRRILVPTNGSAAARHAAEVAFTLATEPGEEVTVLTVVSSDGASIADQPPAPPPGRLRRQLARLLGRDADSMPTDLPDAPEPAMVATERADDARRQIAEALAERGRAAGAAATALVAEGTPEAVIIEMARTGDYDLIVMGTDVKPGPDRLFLGPRVEHILRGAPCPVVIVNAS
ncbi:MAG TPA: universal stress protein, partial [Rubricoccaceae bacterium]